MKKVLLSLAVMAALAACDKNDSIIDDMPMADVDLKSTTESVVTTEAALDDVAEAAEFEVDLFTGTDEAAEVAMAVEGDASLKAGGDQTRNRFRERYKLGVCPSILIEKEEGGWPRTITLDYGDGIELANGRIIAGVIVIVQTDSRLVNGATRTITFQDFSVDGVGISGTIVKTFLIDEMKVTIVRDLTFTLEDGTTIDRYAEYERVWSAGMATPFDPTDDVFEITGNVECVDSDGNSYRREITNRLIKKGGCRWIVAGEVALYKNGVQFATINYGDGECDNIATMTTAEGSEQFVIGKWKRERRQERNQNQNGQ
ncbi:hypothetical protein KDU71_16910 [Carboxylicivirga sediminis]|uniref:Lipoprotein n=1 Tax=Carboxylicivirga sediminis TaxID=2006564 RepID=A0A941F5L3_9BACT|nr:hypothetical protein [Carboxylicivirga sediminis]MBR8537251.1 hypothetical protein [Carboxylicivirga sediminis]